MDVYDFEKCLLDRLEESMSVLAWKDQVIAPSQVRTEWAYFVELQIEPTGWQALWKIPRVICEELHLRYPTVVFGMVEQVLFKELKAILKVQAVQDKNVHLPERNEVALEDLWPTRTQENVELNVERTADCIDRLRFFYNFVWMPWDKDNDDDINWVEKHLETRIRFCYDMRKRSMKRALGAHIRTLLIEAKYIQQRREYLEIGLSDDEELDDTLDKSQITDLMRLHLRLAMIRNEMELLENPEMRRIYEEVNFDDEKHLKDAGTIMPKTEGDKAKTLCYLVTLPCTLARQIELLNIAEKWVSKDTTVQMCSTLQNVLNVCCASDHIYLSPGRHAIKFLEYLNDNGTITGLLDNKMQLDDSAHNAIIVSPDDDSILLVFDGDFTLECLVLDCRNIRTGILVKNGTVRMKCCRMLGDGKSSTQQGIICTGSSTKLVLENCLIKDFATGIVVNEGSSLSLTATEIDNCDVGLDLNAYTKTHFNGSSICKAAKCGVFLDSLPLENREIESLYLKTLDELNSLRLTSPSPCEGECAFKECNANVYITNQINALFASQTLKCVFANDEINLAQETVPSPPPLD